ncbi:helix-turn-helix domain-containing protein [Microbacterium sp. M1A1_1b]
MGDALRAAVDAVGLQVTHVAELEADPGSAWTHRFPASRHHVWVATRSSPVWVGRGDAAEPLRPGTAALLAPGAPRWVGTHPDQPPPRVTPPDFDLGVPTGFTDVHHGAAAFGPLMREVLALPDLVSTAWRPDADTDVLSALQHIDDQIGRRWPGPHRDALARVVVVTIVDAWRPPVLRDNSLTRPIDAIAGTLRLPGAGPGVSVPQLAAHSRVSERTLRRRFLDATGLAPDAFARWFRTLQVRRDLLDGRDPEAVARDHGYSSRAAMDRVLARVEATLGSLHGPDDHFRFPG